MNSVKTKCLVIAMYGFQYTLPHKNNVNQRIICELRWQRTLRVWWISFFVPSEKTLSGEEWRRTSCYIFIQSSTTPALVQLLVLARNIQQFGNLLLTAIMTDIMMVVSSLFNFSILFWIGSFFVFLLLFKSYWAFGVKWWSGEFSTPLKQLRES